MVIKFLSPFRVCFLQIKKITPPLSPFPCERFTLMSRSVELVPLWCRCNICGWVGCEVFHCKCPRKVAMILASADPSWAAQTPQRHLTILCLESEGNCQCSWELVCMTGLGDLWGSLNSPLSLLTLCISNEVPSPHPMALDSQLRDLLWYLRLWLW